MNKKKKINARVKIAVFKLRQLCRFFEVIKYCLEVTGYVILFQPRRQQLIPRR